MGLKPFSPQFYMKHYALLPLVFLSSIVVFGMMAHVVRSAIVNDSMFTRSSKQQGELTDLLINPKHRKLLRFGQVYQTNQDLYDLYEDMKEAEEEQKRKEEKEKKSTEE